jgi:peptidoglycan/LPS O-acetylase OafA/YrhL
MGDCMDASRSQRAGRFPAFDGLRACAACLVLAYHSLLATGVTQHGLLATVTAELKGAVTIFFVISGFLLYVPYARAIAAGEELPGWRSYLRRRAARILPGYWVALLVLSLTTFGAAFIGAHWWRYWGLTQIYEPSTVMNGLPVAWSLCVEVTFYIVLPVLAIGIAALAGTRGPARAIRIQLGVVVALGLASLAARTVVSHSLTGEVPHGGFLAMTALPGMFDWFAIGMALAVITSAWEADPAAWRRVASLASRPGLCWLLAALCFLLGSTMQHGDLFLGLYGTGTHAALGLAAGLLVLPATRRGADGVPIRLLTVPVVAWLGTISYGIYLWHTPLIYFLHGATRPLGHALSAPDVVSLFVAVAAGAVALGAASWYLVERPAQRRAARTRGRRRPATVAQAELVSQRGTA